MPAKSNVVFFVVAFVEIKAGVFAEPLPLLAETGIKECSPYCEAALCRDVCLKRAR